MIYLLVKNNIVIAKIDMTPGIVTALPLLGGKDQLSLVAEQHIDNLAKSEIITIESAASKLGITYKP